MKLNQDYVKLLKDLDNHKFEYFDKCYLPDNNRDKGNGLVLLVILN
jgi:hypothetical protein